MRRGTTSVNTEFETAVADVRSGLRVLQWQLGLLLAITVLTLLLVLRLSVKLGALQF